MAGFEKSTKDSKVSEVRRTHTEKKQTDFELEFYRDLLERYPEYLDVLRVYGNLLSRKGRHLEGLMVDRRIVRLKPKDPIAHYNLACTLSMLKQVDQALISLRRSMELGYKDFRYLRQDKDLDPLRSDTRFTILMMEFDHI